MATNRNYPLRGPKVVVGAVLGLAWVVVVGCGGWGRFQPGPAPWVEPAQMASGDTLVVSGTAVADVGGVRYRARWVLAGAPGRLRIQVFSTDGTWLAEMGVEGDSGVVLVPETMECHVGPWHSLPVDSLLGTPLPWRRGVEALAALLWPHALGDWIPGSWGGSPGWFSEARGLFVEPDRTVPRVRRVRWEGSPRGQAEVKRFDSSQARIPAQVVVRWPGEDVTLWVDLKRRQGGEARDGLLHVRCPGHWAVRRW